MKKENELKSVEEYAKELDISTEELMGLIKVGYYKGENHSGSWYVQPNLNKPKTFLGRLAYFILFGGLFSTIILTKRSDFDLPIGDLFIEILSNSYIGAILGLALFVLSKINQEYKRDDFIKPQ